MDPGLLGEPPGETMWAHHQEADRLHPQLARGAQMLYRDVGLGGVRGDARDR